MSTVDLAETLTHEHHEIDARIEAFTQALDQGRVEREPLGQAFEALRRHIYLEEELLFPPIRRAGMMMPLLVMTKEHGEVWQLMNQLEDMLGTPDADLDAVRTTCRELLAGLDQHNSKEEPIVYPRASTDLTAQETQVLTTFLDTGSIPAGWVCEAAR